MRRLLGAPSVLPGPEVWGPWAEKGTVKWPPGLVVQAGVWTVQGVVRVIDSPAWEVTPDTQLLPRGWVQVVCPGQN